MFTNRLTTTLTLTIKEKKHTIPGGNIKYFQLQWSTWGFWAKLIFWLVSQEKQSEDTLFEPFVGNDPIEATIVVDRTYDKAGETVDPTCLNGWVETREVVERAFPDLFGNPVLHRRYTITCQDPAAAFWGHHYPATLCVDSTHEALIRQETPPDLTVRCTYPAAKITHPILALGLGTPPHSSSFYDFVIWLCHRERIGFVFDAKSKTYTLTQEKSQGSSQTIPVDDVEQVDILLSDIPRNSTEVLSGSAEVQASPKKISNSDAYGGVRRDTLLIPVLSSELETQAKTEREALRIEPPTLSAHFARYPSLTLKPQNLYNFDAEWSDEIYLAKKTYRLQSISIEATAEGQAATDEVNAPSNTYNLDVIGVFEELKDTRFSLPSYSPPPYPFYVEGKIVSDTGTDTEGTYQIYEDAKTKIEHHLVTTYPFKKKIRVPFSPHTMPGHFYFPPYRDQRVLLALDFERANIAQYLDWRAGARLPKASQGNQLLLGKRAEDQTSIRHTYVSTKPVLTIERTFDKDLQTIEVSEGKIRFETKSKT